MIVEGKEDLDFIPRYNAYRCKACGKEYLTVDLARGVTPMFMTCMRTEGCGGRAISLMYSAHITLLGLPLLFEWVKASDADLEELKRRKKKELLQHIMQGGLMRRVCDTAPEWVKALA